MLVNEIFESIQGEGKYIGNPVLFIRLSGCTRSCNFCDTKYHKQGKEMNVKDIIKRINKSNMDIVVWTGGEPLLQQDEMYEVIYKTTNKYHQLETNGDILPREPSHFTYICFSPKMKQVAKNVLSFVYQLEDYIQWDIKIVTDLVTVGCDMLDDATYLMPITTDNPKSDEEIKKKVWNYCIKNKIKYTPRIHRDVWNNKKGV